MGDHEISIPLQLFMVMLLVPHICSAQMDIETLPCVMIKADDATEIFHSPRRMKAFTCMLEIGSRDHPDAPLPDATKKFLKCLSDAGISPRYDTVVNNIALSSEDEIRNPKLAGFLNPKPM